MPSVQPKPTVPLGPTSAGQPAALTAKVVGALANVAQKAVVLKGAPTKAAALNAPSAHRTLRHVAVSSSPVARQVPWPVPTPAVRFAHADRVSGAWA